MSRDSSSLVLDSSINEEENATPAHVLSRGDAIKAARLQSPRTADVASIMSLTLERRGIRSVSRGALSGLVNLVQLNLARNELTSLRGLETAVSLESLSLYYNRVAYLEELQHLIPLKKLTTLDLRLNPVTREFVFQIFVFVSLPSKNYFFYRQSDLFFFFFFMHSSSLCLQTQVTKHIVVMLFFIFQV